MAEVPAELDPIIRHFPKFWGEAGHLFTQTLYESAKLDRKTIELVLLSLLAGRRWETGVRVHTQAALDHGATPDEIRGAILLSMAVFSTSSAVQGLHWAEQVLAPISARSEQAPRRKVRQQRRRGDRRRVARSGA